MQKNINQKASNLFDKGIIPFRYTVSQNCKTSCAVFDSRGVFVKRLWTCEDRNAGTTYSYTWNGTDESGLLCADGDYEYRMIYHQVQYQWEGGIGNTSTNNTGANIHGSLGAVSCLCRSGSNLFYGVSYAEGNYSIGAFATSNIQVNNRVNGNGTLMTFDICSDGTNIYTAAKDAFSPTNNFVLVQNAGNYADINMTGSAAYTVLNTTNTFHVLANLNSAILSIAVQQSGNYLFFSRANGTITVWNKTTGSTFDITAYSNPNRLCVDPTNDNILWLNYNNTKVEKFTINSDGTLTSTGVVINTSNTVSTISAGSSVIRIADSVALQIGSYNKSTGALVGTFGQANGHRANAVVQNDRFGIIADIETMTDDSYWVVDSQNFRMQHYDSSNNFIERVMYLPGAYNCGIDKNNPTRIFSRFLEFSVDYAKTLDNGVNGSWTLVRNWNSTFVPVQQNQYLGMRTPTTYTDAYGTFTWALVSDASGQYQIVELKADGTVWQTGVFVPFINGSFYNFCSDNCLRKINRYTNGATGGVPFYKMAFTRNGSGLPVLGAETLEFTSQDTITPDFAGASRGEFARPDVRLTYDGDTYRILTNVNLNPNVNHLFAVRESDGLTMWKNLPSTSKRYFGGFPLDRYDIGNTVGYGGNTHSQMGPDSVFFGYNGEFWKQSQTNMYYHFHASGLQIGQMGALPSGSIYPGYGNSGNALQNWCYKINASTGYLWHSGEDAHSIVHRWKVTGLDTIGVLSQAFTINVKERGQVLQAFDSLGRNSTNMQSARVDDQISYNPARSIINNSGTTLPDTSYLVSAFIKIRTGEVYTFYVTTAAGFSLTVNGVLVINGQSNTVYGEYSGTISLTPGQYPIALTIDYPAGTSKDVLLQYSSSSITKKTVPSSALVPRTIPYGSGDFTQGVDLLTGLPNMGAECLTTYSQGGWTISQSYTDFSDQNNQWTVQTGVIGFDSVSPDVLATFSSATAGVIKTIDRDLGNINAHLITGWKLDSMLSNWGILDLTSATLTIFRILDINGKEIVRLRRSQGTVGMNVNDSYTLTSDNSDPNIPRIASSGNVGPTALTMAASGSSFTVTLGTLPPVTVPVYDSAALIMKPQRIQMYFSKLGTGSYTMSMGFSKMKMYVNQ